MVSDKELSDESQSEPAEAALSDAQRARAERSRQRARALRDARLVRRTADNSVQTIDSNKLRALDSGGGFLLEQEAEAAAPAPAPPAPLVHRSEQPHCLLCEKPFPQSYLFDNFDYSVCDGCRDDADAHRLLTRTEAKSEYLLKDCDLDARPPPLRCVRRPNPHRARAHDMRLYLRAQLDERALLVWGSRERLEAERAARDERRERSSGAAARRRLRALRMDVRSSLYDRTRAQHEHAFGPEAYDAQADVYRRECACGHVQTYEKM